MAGFSKTQLFSLLMLFEIGSTTLFARGIEAKQDAWLAILIAMLFGFVLLWVYTKIQSYYPEKNWVEILSTVLGKWIAVPLISLYILYFFYSSTFILSEFGELIVTIFLPLTPIVVILGLFMLTSVYVLCLGYEVLARLSEIMLPVVVLFNLVIYTLIFVSGQADFSQLKPVLASGINPVLQVTFPSIVNFPFGEIVVFLLYWSLVDRKTSLRTVSLAAIGISGVFITVSTIMLISVLGVEYASNATFPFYDLVKTINIMDILTNLDVIVVVVMFIGGFFKMTIYFGGGVLAVKSLFKIGNEKWIIVISGICTTWFTIVFYTSFPFQRWSGEMIMNRYIHNFFQIICPALILMILWVKSKLIPAR